MSFETLTVEHTGPIARVTLDRPEKRNAMNTTSTSVLMVQP